MYSECRSDAVMYTFTKELSKWKAIHTSSTTHKGVQILFYFQTFKVLFVATSSQFDSSGQQAYSLLIPTRLHSANAHRNTKENCIASALLTVIGVISFSMHWQVVTITSTTSGTLDVVISTRLYLHLATIVSRTHASGMEPPRYQTLRTSTEMTDSPGLCSTCARIISGYAK
jgi:hypothetical protein